MWQFSGPRFGLELYQGSRDVRVTVRRKVERRRVLAGAMLLAGVAFGARTRAMEPPGQEPPLFDGQGFRATRYQIGRANV